MSAALITGPFPTPRFPRGRLPYIPVPYYKDKHGKRHTPWDEEPSATEVALSAKLEEYRQAAVSRVRTAIASLHEDEQDALRILLETADDGERYELVRHAIEADRLPILAASFYVAPFCKHCSAPIGRKRIDDTLARRNYYPRVCSDNCTKQRYDDRTGYAAKLLRLRKFFSAVRSAERATYTRKIRKDFEPLSLLGTGAGLRLVRRSIGA